ncbi:hypothetical protein V8Z80_12535 [Orrella sp. JC864]|uniref:hypothetical protein n=1 Tax=Orrella sp. JC864 TaxID=3120298 RepID=UPI00300918EA
MCADVDYEDRTVYRKVPPPSEALIERTRLVEAGMPGERVPQQAWDTFFAVSCGAMDMRSFQRMFEARRIALSFLALQRARYARRHDGGTGLRCIGD